MSDSGRSLAETSESGEVLDHVSRTLADERSDGVDARGAVLTQAGERTTLVHVYTRHQTTPTAAVT